MCASEKRIDTARTCSNVQANAFTSRRIVSCRIEEVFEPEYVVVSVGYLTQAFQVRRARLLDKSTMKKESEAYRWTEAVIR